MQDELAVCSAQAASYQIEADDARTTIARLRGEVEHLAQHQAPEYTIEVVNSTLDELKKALTLADEYVLSKLIDYAKLDSYELVKNLAKVTNRANVAETIAYRDGALGRNEALIQILK